MSERMKGVGLWRWDAVDVKKEVDMEDGWKEGWKNGWNDGWKG